MAHPHVFVDARTGFVFDTDGLLTGLRISWTYDEFTSLILFETLNLDTDGDGVFNDEDRAAVIKGETNWPPEYKGDVYLEVAGKDFPLGRPVSAAASLENNQVIVSFDLPLSEAVRVDDSPAFLRLYDPIFYYAYTILASDDLNDLPESCAAQIVPFEPNAAESSLQKKLAELSRDEIPAEQNIGRVFADEVRLTCR